MLRLTGDQALVDALRSDWKQADLSAADRQMLVYAEKLTLRPWDMVEQDVADLRDVGFTDGAILDINQVTGYYAYVNRLADGLGVEIEGYFKDGEDYKRYREMLER
ncbi:MAG: putative peroxidase-related enzyme [Cellvibrionaceae bacterium]